MKYIVYQTINIVNNKIYIGVHKTKDPNTFDGYIGCGINIFNAGTYNKPQTTLLFAVNKYGTDKFKRSIIKTFDNLEDAYKLEEELVTEEFIRRPDVYNMIRGGIHAPTNAIKIYQFSLDGQLLKDWESSLEAADFFNISHSAILNAIKFKGSCKNFFWCRDNKINPQEYSLNTGTICYKYDKFGKLIDTFNSIPEAAKDANEFPQSIQRAIKGGFEVKGFYYSSKLFEIFKIPAKTNLKNNPIYIYDLLGNYITELKGIKLICEYFNIKSNCVIYTAIRCQKPYKNFLFSFEKKEKLNPVINKRNISKEVECYSLTGDLIEVFSSITKAVEKYGTGVQKVLKGQRELCKGYIFKYKSL